MAKFPPIQYARTLPEVVRQPRAAMDVSTGEEAIARGLMQFGGALAGIADTIHRQESAAEYSELKRQVDEKGFAAFNSVSGDEDADVKVWENLQKDLATLQSKRPNVQAALQSHINEVMPNWKDSFDKNHLVIRKKNAHAKFELEGGSALASGNLQEYYQQLNTRLALKDITRAEFDFKMKNAIPDSVLEQSRHLIASDNAESLVNATNMLNSLDEKTLSTEQLEYRNKLLKMTEQTSKAKSDKALTDVIIQKENLTDATPTEKANATAEMKQQLVSGGVKGDALEKWFGILDKWSRGDKDPTEEYNPQIYAATLAAVDLDPTAISDTQIYSLVGLGKEGGITSQQASSLVDLRKRNVDEMPSMSKEVHGRYQRILKGMYDAELFGEGLEGATTYAETANILTLWSNANKDATIQETEQFFAQLTAEHEKKSWLKMLFTPPIIQVGRLVSAYRQRKKLEELKGQAQTQTVENKTDEELLSTIMSE